MGRPRKTLLEHVRDGTFIPSRHAHLLESPGVLEQVDESDPYMVRLRDLARLYPIAEGEQRRRQVAVAFAHAVRGDPTGWEELMTTADGRRLGWRRTSSGRWALLTAETKAQQRARERAYGGYKQELYGKLDSGEFSGASAKELTAFALETARRHGIAERDALAAIQLEIALRTITPADVRRSWGRQPAADIDDDEDDGFDPGL